MNKKIISLLFLLIILVSVTITYAFTIQSTTENKYQTTGSTIDENTLTSEIDTPFLDENASVDIGEMI
ncbi:MAG: hypothetical protein NTX92_08275 [Euryarchaeota archaeon]|nr:hypothetical protein [Euryarchaeota archaeon]